MADAFSAYDVLAKRDTPSWNARTRDVINKRLALAIAENVLGDTQLATLRVIVARVCPDPPDRPATNTLAMIVRKIAEDEGDGYRPNTSPRTAECWRRGLDAIEDEARLRFNCGFARIEPDQADEILYAVESGKVRSVLWGNLSPELFWKWRLLPDLVSSHWAQPSLWSAMGFGGPASPRGYVRLTENRHDPWEATEHAPTGPSHALSQDHER